MATVACHSLTLCTSGKSGSGKADSGPCSLAAGQAARGCTEGVLSCSVAWIAAQDVGIYAPQAAAAREGEAQLEQVCCVARARCCCTLLLYSPTLMGS